MNNYGLGQVPPAPTLAGTVDPTTKLVLLGAASLGCLIILPGAWKLAALAPAFLIIGAQSAL
jgi:hypothetical protein